MSWESNDVPQASAQMFDSSANCRYFNTVPMKTDQTNPKFTEFDLPISSEGYAGGAYTSEQKFFGAGSSSVEISGHALCASSNSEDKSCYQAGVCTNREVIAKRDSESSSSSEGNSFTCNPPDDIFEQAENAENCEKELEGMTEPVSHFHMTRVDWRWAAKKGFWDKDKKCWIESVGGKAAYIAQRSKRIMVREQRISRRQKAANPKPAT